MTEVLKSYLKFIGCTDNDIENMDKSEIEIFLRSNDFQKYKDGYEQGQKDCRKQEIKDGNPFFIATELAKQNEELKAQVNALTNENNVLIKGLGCETCGITETYKELNNEIAVLKEKIEHRNCADCSNRLQVR